MSLKLSEGAIEIIMAGGRVDCPIMQILGCKKIAASNSQERYRLLISDGKHLNSFAMIATQLNDLVTSGQLCDFTVVKIIRSICSTVNSGASEKERRVMVILELEVVKKGTEVGIRLGNPVQLDGSAINNSSNNQNNQPANNAQPLPKPPAPKIGNSAPFSAQVRSTPSQSLPLHPISGLNPYQNKWSIKARVTQKTDIRTYANARGEGKLFSVVFADESGEIKCTGFNSACDKFSDLLEVNKVYLVSNCSVKAANKKFCTGDYEMTFNDDSQITPSKDDTGIPANVFNFTPISKLSDMAVDSFVDIIGIAKETNECQAFTSRNGKDLKKREVTLVDESNVAVTLTLWGDQAVNFDGNGQPVLACKGLKISDFQGGRSVSAFSSSAVMINPDISEAHRLRGWYDDGGAGQNVSSLSTKTGTGSTGTGNWVLLGEVASRGLGMGDKADYFAGVATVLMARSENAVYKACPGQDCKKKVMDMNNGSYRCEKCNRDYDSFVYRLLLSVQVSDYSGSMWVSTFNEEAQKILNCTAQQIGEALDNRDESYKDFFASVAFNKFQFRFRTKMESYNDESRLKTTIVGVEPVDYNTYGRRLLADFKKEVGLVTTR